MVGGASLTSFGVQAGESIGVPFRSLALLAPRGRVFGTGPNDFPVTHTARWAGITSAMTGPDWRLTVVGERTIAFSREQLLAMPQSNRTHTITCSTDGWSTPQSWTGVRLAELARLVDAAEGGILRRYRSSRDSLFRRSVLPFTATGGRFSPSKQVNGVDISLDRGYPRG